MKTAHDLPCQLQMRQLVLPHRDGIRLIKHDVRSHEHGIADKAVVYVLRLMPRLLLEGGDPCQPAKGGDHAEQGIKLHHLGPVGLDKKYAPLRINPRRQPVERHLTNVSLEISGILQRC